MKAIILAAGQGSRLRPLTNEVPKCMVKYNGKEIIKYILDSLHSCGVNDIAIVDGYKKEVLESFLADEQLSFFTNDAYAETNMVETLFNAESFMDDDLIISYADIIYSDEVLKKLIQSDADISVVVDQSWRDLWSIRMDDPLSDAETLKIKDGKIIELGKKALSYDEIEGQYIGLIKISSKKLQEFIRYYHSLDKNEIYDGKDFNNMYMTTFIQRIIDNLTDVTPIIINGGWLEIDSVEDLDAYNAKGLSF